MKNKTKKKKATKSLAIVGLLLNIILWPGLGTLMNRKFGIGAMQMILSLLGLALMFVIPSAALLVVIAWIWALVSGIKIIVKAWS